MIDVPKYIGREFRPFDWYGWLMCLIACGVMYLLVIDTSMDWITKIIFFGIAILSFLDYVWRVSYGRIYRLVYYDTLLYTMYEIGVGNEVYFICASDEEELGLYMDVNYPSLEYRIIEEHPLESFIKKEHYQ